MRILIVAMADSIHVVRWLFQVSDQGWDIHLFPSIDYGYVHRGLRNLTIHHSIYPKQKGCHSSLRFRGFPIIVGGVADLAIACLRKYFSNYRALQLIRKTKKLRPDIIHSMEIQAAGYLTLAAKKSFDGQFPPWIVTNWGSDLYLFGRLSAHEPKIREVLNSCDYYTCECQRDVGLAKEYGLKGEVLDVLPNGGGIDLEYVSKLRQPGPVSSRRSVMLKGYQHWAGRALVGLRALERCADLLKDYTVVLYSASPAVVIAAELFSKSTGIPTKIVPDNTPHNDILKLHGQSRISLGLSISDAISTSLLDAIVMGSFPIQSWTSCANEWVKDGETGILVPPEDPDVVELAIRRALTDDRLVNQAAEKNYEVSAEKLDQAELKKKAVDIYNRVAATHGINSFRTGYRQHAL